MAHATASYPAGMVSRDLADAGYVIPQESPYRKLIISITAPEKTGKTDWALRTTPETVCVVALDTGTDEIVRKIRNKFKKKILLNLIEIPPIDPSKKVEDRMNLYEKIWNQFVRAVEAAVANDTVKTLVIDTATEAWELCRLARFGKLTQVLPHHYGPVNAEFRELVRNCGDRMDLISIWLHKQKKEYKTGKDGKDSWTGRFERAGFGDMPYLADLNAETFFIRREQEGGGIERGFGLRVVDCRQNPNLAGETYETILGSNMDLAGFDCVAADIFADQDEE